MNHRRTASRLVSRAATAAALAAALGPVTTATATAAAPAVPPPAATAPAAGSEHDGGWHQDGLTLNSADNKKVDAFVARARRAERAISPQVRTAAVVSHAALIGFDQRLKSPDSLKRKVATKLRENPGQTADQALGTVNDAVRFTLQWPERGARQAGAEQLTAPARRLPAPDPARRLPAPASASAPGIGARDRLVVPSRS
ncbi:hypothetical protein [Streptomyces lydicus]|uniref:hypothetical protein n=1 Tax=Streptomyces lydicus TaxID=47763 RepID=UPI00370137DA